ncbi:group II intron maturase-specific domain-containing protein [Streptomyces violascens]|uniref:group II intron maturase-specific domain-containing protein n=1 Tax=Streptomyces violascens TaxID=67381 RepID=UPI0035714FF8
MRRARQRIKQIIQRTNGQGSHEDLILTLNPFVKGWSMYYSPTHRLGRTGILISTPSDDCGNGL